MYEERRKRKIKCMEKINDEYKCDILKRILFHDCSAQISVNLSELKPVQFLFYIIKN
jgi:hypothetical protein